MKREPLWIAFLCFVTMAGATGCGRNSAESDSSASDAALSELESATETSSDRVQLASAKSDKTENLELRLKVGDRFPLIKTIEQRLRQVSAPKDAPIESWSQLTLTLAIHVEDIKDGVKQLGVSYQRVRYEHDIAGEKVRYDSAIAEKSIPEAAQVYHGLANNGFSFLLSADNRILKLIEFDAFLRRCVRHVPAQQQQEMLTRLVASTEDEGIANFVDDSIGLLPYNIDSRHAGGSVKVGDTWRKTRQIVRPVPMTIDTRYRLESLNERYANVELLGQIIPAKIETFGNGPIRQGSLAETMTLRDGHCFGTCVIDRETSLPIQSRVVRQLNMSLKLPNGATFDQQKEITTTIRAFPQQSAQQSDDAAEPSSAEAGPDLPDPTSGRTARSQSKPSDVNVRPAGFEK